MKNDITFDELVMTGARSSAVKTGLGSRVPFPHCCKVKGNNLLRIRIKGKIYAVCVGAKVDREAWKQGLERLLELLHKRAQASSGPRGHQ